MIVTNCSNKKCIWHRNWWWAVLYHFNWWCKL